VQKRRRFGEPIAVSLGYAFDQAVKAQPPQLLGHAAQGELVGSRAPKIEHRAGMDREVD
jgi:hypothetical protein